MGLDEGSSYDFEEAEDDEYDHRSHVDYDFLSVLSKPKDYYKILEVDYDASDEMIRSNYIRLALKWHPDKKKNDSSTSTFQQINEAYQVLSDPVKRGVYDCNITDYLNRNKGLILTCNGLGMKFSIW